jgi:hypothetical protein
MHRKVLGTVLTLVALLTLAAQASSPITRAQESKRVGLVVGFGDGTFITRCVTFTEAEISGYEALMRSGMEIAANGGAVCRIDETGCPAADCFCAIPYYWSYWHLMDGTWQYSGSGADSYTVQDGDIEGWNWGAEPPSTLSFYQICSASTIHLPLVLTAGGWREAQD